MTHLKILLFYFRSINPCFSHFQGFRNLVCTWRFTSYVRPCCSAITYDLSADRNDFIFSVQESCKFIDNGRGVSSILRNVAKSLSFDKASHPRRIEPSATPLWEPRISKSLQVFGERPWLQTLKKCGRKIGAPNAISTSNSGARVVQQNTYQAVWDWHNS
jgi:hypothetical protein